MSRYKNFLISNFFSSNARYFFCFQLIFVLTVIILSSLGAFFHFLLNHEISIVESWLHINQWEILIISKAFSVFLLTRWFRLRLYQLKSIKDLAKELLSWPDSKTVIVAVFMGLSFLFLGDVDISLKNMGYWNFQLTSFFALFLFFSFDFMVMTYLDEVLSDPHSPPQFILCLVYLFIFFLSFLLSVPNYYDLVPYVLFCYSSLLYLTGKSFREWSNVICFLLLFVAPMGSFFGLDPVWGEDFSYFHFANKPNMALLAVIWMISFFYYRYRDLLISLVRKLLR